MSTLQELIARVEAAKAGSSELDEAIGCALNLIPTGDGWKQSGPTTWHKNLRWPSGRADWDDCFQFGAYTSSIDAAVKLVEEKLPGWGLSISGSDLDGVWGADLWKRNKNLLAAGNMFDADAPTPALALCNALLRALAG